MHFVSKAMWPVPIHNVNGKSIYTFVTKALKCKASKS